MWLKLLLLISALSFALAASNPRKLYKTTESDDENESEVLITPFTDPFDNIDYRLPNNSKPLRYDIFLSTDNHKGNFTFTGRVTIQIQVIENSTEVTLHYRELTIVNVALLRSGGGTIQSNVAFTQREDVEFLIIRPTVRLIEGTIYSIVITYIGELRNDDAGFYRSSYLDISNTRRWLATTQFESTDARHAFPW
jgi:aminopeptidase N